MGISISRQRDGVAVGGERDMGVSLNGSRPRRAGGGMILDAGPGIAHAPAGQRDASDAERAAAVLRLAVQAEGRMRRIVDESVPGRMQEAAAAFGNVPRAVLEHSRDPLEQAALVGQVGGSMTFHTERLQMRARDGAHAEIRELREARYRGLLRDAEEAGGLFRMQQAGTGERAGAMASETTAPDAGMEHGSRGLAHFAAMARTMEQTVIASGRLLGEDAAQTEARLRAARSGLAGSFLGGLARHDPDHAGALLSQLDSVLEDHDRAAVLGAVKQSRRDRAYAALTAAFTTQRGVDYAGAAIALEAAFPGRSDGERDRGGAEPEGPADAARGQGAEKLPGKDALQGADDAAAAGAGHRKPRGAGAGEEPGTALAGGNGEAFQRVLTGLDADDREAVRGLLEAAGSRQVYEAAKGRAAERRRVFDAFYEQVDAGNVRGARMLLERDEALSESQRGRMLQSLSQSRWSTGDGVLLEKVRALSAGEVQDVLDIIPGADLSYADAALLREVAGAGGEKAAMENRLLWRAVETVLEAGNDGFRDASGMAESVAAGASGVASGGALGVASGGATGAATSAVPNVMPDVIPDVAEGSAEEGTAGEASSPKGPDGSRPAHGNAAAIRQAAQADEAVRTLLGVVAAARRKGEDPAALLRQRREGNVVDDLVAAYGPERSANAPLGAMSDVPAVRGAGARAAGAQPGE